MKNSHKFFQNSFSELYQLDKGVKENQQSFENLREDWDIEWRLSFFIRSAGFFNAY